MKMGDFYEILKRSHNFFFSWKPHEKFHCPTTKAPFFFTRLNSKNQTVMSSTPKTSPQNESESEVWKLRDVNPLTIMAAVAMVLIFTVFTVRLMTRERRVRISIAERDSRENKPFFSSEVKQHLHY